MDYMNNSDLQIFSERLKQLRNSLNITQKEFAKKIGVTAAALSAYENNQKNPSIAVARRIAENFHVSIDWLCGFSEKMVSNKKPKKFSDIIQLLFQIEDSYLQITPKTLTPKNFNKKTFLSFFGDDIEDIENIEDMDSVIFFDDTEMKFFIKEWEKMKNLYKKNLIDKEVYNLWREKITTQYIENYDL